MISYHFGIMHGDPTLLIDVGGRTSGCVFIEGKWHAVGDILISTMSTRLTKEEFIKQFPEAHARLQAGLA